MLDQISTNAAFARLVACSRLVGHKFCEALVGALAENLSVPTVLLATLDPAMPGRARTVAAWSNGGLVPSFDYDLGGSPCCEVMKGTTCHFADDVVARFPEDILLSDMGARGYIGVPLFNHGGRAVGVLAAISDKAIQPSPHMLSLLEIFGSRAAAELERDASTSRSEYLGRLVDGSSSEIYVFDAATLRFVMVNKGARENLGYSVEELQHLTPVDLKPDFTRAAFLALVEPLRSGREPVLSFQTRHRRKDGTDYPVEVRLQLIGDFGAPVFYAAIQDITRRAAVEAELRETRERLHRLFAQSPAGIVEADSTGRMTLVNKAWCDMLGYTEAELLERTVFDVTDPDSLAGTRGAIGQLLSGVPGLMIEKNYVRKDGRPITAMSNVSALRADDGTFLGVAAVVTDVSERIRAEERLRASETRLRKILDGTLAFVGVMRPDGTLLEANAPALAAAGISRDDVIGRKFWDCYWWAYDPAVAQRLKEAVARAATGSVVRYDEVIRIKDDGRITMDFLLSPCLDDDGNVDFLVPSGLDVTERKRQEAMLKELMREVNHRSKNLLSVVQAIARQMPDASPQDFKRDFGMRVRSLAACQDLLVSSGWQSISLDALIRSQLMHFADLVDRRIVLIGPDARVPAAATQAFSMAIYELATNAVKYGALSNDSGKVEIRWSVDGDDDGAQSLDLTWQEIGGPRVQEPRHAGFGSVVLNRLVAAMMDGESRSSFEPDGFRWQLSGRLENPQRTHRR